MRPKLAYIVSRFPHLPETFILREMVELENQNWSISLYPLISQRQPVMHQDAAKWEQKAKKATFFVPEVWTANFKFLFNSPSCYLKTWGEMVWFNLPSANLLVRALILFPKAVWMADQMKQEGIEHIHAHYATHPALAAWIINKLTGISYSFTVHAHDIFVRKAMLAEKVRDAIFVVAISNYNREFLSRLVGEWTRPKMYVIHCGITPELYQPRKVSGQLEESDIFRLVTIGSLQPYKGQEVLIRACKRLVERGVPVICEIIGEGTLHNKLSETIRNCGLEGRVNLAGAMSQEKIAARLPEADCYVQPSVITLNGKMEGIPLALMEAMACEIPVVASDISGIPELVIPGKTGFLVPPGDDAALADKLTEIYNRSADVQKFVQAGYEIVRQEFNLSTQVRKLAALFESLS